METQQIFFFGLPVVFGLSLFVYTYEYEPGNKYKDYLLVLGYAFIGIILFIIIDVIFLGYSINEILLGRILFMHSTPFIACYTFIISILLSIISDIIYPLIQPFISKAKLNKKFRTPKIK